MAVILLIDDEPAHSVLEMWTEWAKISASWEYATSGEKGLARLAEGGIDLVLMDGHLVSERGADVVRALRERGDSTCVCMFSSSEEENVRGVREGAEFRVNKRTFLEEWMRRDEPDASFREMDALATAIAIVVLRT